MSPSGAGYALAVLFAINLMNFFDRQILGAVGEQIRREWSLGDTALGALGTAFTLLYAFVGVPFGRLADRGVRKYILAGGVFIWSLLTAASGLARNFWELFVVRLGVGVGEASCAPAAISLIGDLFRTQHRARATATFMLGLPIGLGLSFLVGGYVGQRWGWRAALFIAAVPGLLCAVAALFIREPARGMVEEHKVGQRCRPGSPYRLVLSIPTLWWIIASGALHNFNMYALGAFLASFLIRYHGVSLYQAGLISMLVYGLSGIVGLVGGGIAADALVQEAQGWPAPGRHGGHRRLCAVHVSLVDASGGRRHGLCAVDGHGRRRDVRVLRHGVLDDPGHRRTGPPRDGNVALLRRDVPRRGVARAARHRHDQRLFHDAGQRSRPAWSITPLKALEPFRAAGLHPAMYAIPLLAALLAVVLYAASRTVRRDVEALHAWTSTPTLRATPLTQIAES